MAVVKLDDERRAHKLRLEIELLEERLYAGDHDEDPAFERRLRAQLHAFDQEFQDLKGYSARVRIPTDLAARRPARRKTGRKP